MEEFIFSPAYFIIGGLLSIFMLLWRVYDRQEEVGIYRLQGDILYGIFSILLVVIWPFVVIILLFMATGLLISLIPVLIINLLSVLIYGKNK